MNEGKMGGQWAEKEMIGRVGMFVLLIHYFSISRSFFLFFPLLCGKKKKGKRQRKRENSKFFCPVNDMGINKQGKRNGECMCVGE